MTGRPEQLQDHTFFMTDWYVADLAVRMDDLAAEKGWTVDVWEEDGLGEAKGCFLRLPSGRVVLLRELTHAVEHLGSKGPSVAADVRDVACLGAATVFDEVAKSFGLRPEQVLAVAGDNVQRAAEAFAESVRERAPSCL